MFDISGDIQRWMLYIVEEYKKSTSDNLSAYLNWGTAIAQIEYLADLLMQQGDMEMIFAYGRIAFFHGSPFPFTKEKTVKYALKTGIYRALLEALSNASDVTVDERCLAIAQALQIAYASRCGGAAIADAAWQDNLFIEDGNLRNCRNHETNLILPDTIRTIHRCCFDAFSRSHLTSITIPAQVESIAKQCFDQLLSLEEIHVAADNPRYCSQNGILFDSRFCSLLFYPKGRSDLRYAVPEGTKSIDFDAFRGTKLREIALPESLERIGEYAFSSCERLTSITLPSGVKDVATCAFSNCSCLTSVTVLGMDTDFAEDAFEDTPQVCLRGRAGSSAQAFAENAGLAYIVLEQGG